MPLRDHFHPPLDELCGWPSIHTAWATYIAENLRERHLPPRYRVEVTARLGAMAEVDIATHETAEPRVGGISGNGATTTATWAPPRSTRTLDVSIPTEDVFEVRVSHGARQLVAVIELVSPANKDRPANRRAFAVKCVSYLRTQVSVVIVDIVTHRHADLLEDVLALVEQERGQPWPGDPPLYAVALRNTKVEEKWRLETWEEPLAVGRALPTMPLWLADDLSVPLELEPAYLRACRLNDVP